MAKEGMIRYSLENGVTGYFRGTPEQAAKHIEDLKRKRKKSSHVYDLSGNVGTNTTFPQAHNERRKAGK